MNYLRVLKCLIISTLCIPLFFPATTIALSEDISVDYTSSYSMKYVLDQTFQTYEDSDELMTARTKIYYSIDFEANGDWNTSSLYEAKFRKDLCGDLYHLEIDFKYIFSNLTREINKVIDDFHDWPIEDAKPTFYSGENPGTVVPIMLDEMMIIRLDVQKGIIEGSLNFNQTTKLSLYGKEYEVYEFLIKKKIDDAYYR